MLNFWKVDKSETWSSFYNNAPNSLIQTSRFLLHTTSNDTVGIYLDKLHPSISRKLLSKLSPLHLSTNNSKFLKGSLKNSLGTPPKKFMCSVYSYFKLLNQVPGFPWYVITFQCLTIQIAFLSGPSVTFQASTTTGQAMSKQSRGQGERDRATGSLQAGLLSAVIPFLFHPPWLSPH